MTTTMTTLPTLQRGRLLLRAWRDDNDDLAAFHTIQGDARVIWWGHSASLEDSRAVLSERRSRAGAPRFGFWAVSEDNVVVGNVFLVDAGGRTEIGWHVARAAQGRGIAGLAAAALVEHAAATGLGVVAAPIVPVNVPSQRVARRLGFVVDGSVVKAGLFHELWVKRL